MNWLNARIPALCFLIAIPAFAQEPATAASSNALCTFEDGVQIRITYSGSGATNSDKLPKDKMWTPANQPMVLFTASPVKLAGTVIPAGAYSLYMIPGRSSWTLIVNKDVTPGHEYDSSKDLVRATMELGKLPVTQPLQIGFARMGPKQCNMRFYYGQIGTYTDINEQ